MSPDPAAAPVIRVTWARGRATGIAKGPVGGRRRIAAPNRTGAHGTSPLPQERATSGPAPWSGTETGRSNAYQDPVAWS